MPLRHKPSLVCIVLAGLPLSTAQAWDVLVEIHGEIIGNTCTVASDSTDIKVNLGTVSTRQFSGVGSVSNIRQPFTLNLENCSAAFSGVKIRFTGMADDDNAELLQLDAGGASGVGIRIFNTNGNTVPLNTWSDIWPGNGDGTVTLTFSAALEAARIPVEAGNVSAIATWELEYQ